MRAGMAMDVDSESGLVEKVDNGQATGRRDVGRSQDG
jgi:hypothetical protein